MVRYFALLFVFCCVNRASCLHGSCGTQPEPAAPQGAAGCGCENLQRAAAAGPVEDRAASAEPVDKYSRGANERPLEAQGDEKKTQSQVIDRSLPLLGRRHDTLG